MFVNGFEKKKANICSQLATVHAYVPSNEIFRVFAFKYGKFLLPPTFSYGIFGFKSAVRKRGSARKQQTPAPYKNLNTLGI